MNKLIDYATVQTTKGLLAAHLINARMLVSNGKLLVQEARRRFGKATDERVLELFNEVNETLTLAKRHLLTPADPFGVCNGLEYGVIRGKIIFLKHFEKFRR